MALVHPFGPRGRRLVVVAVLFGFPLACRPADSGPGTYTDSSGLIRFAREDRVGASLTGELLLRDARISRPAQMILTNGRLWLTDRSGDPYVHVIDLTARRIESSFGNTGDGPGDFQGVGGLSLRPGDTIAPWSADPGLRRLTRLRSFGSKPIPPVITLHGGSLSVGILWLAPNRIFGFGDVDTNRIQLFDSTGVVLQVASGRLLGPDSIPMEVRRSVSTGVITCSSDAARRLAALFVGGGRIDVYDIDGVFRVAAEVPFASNGDFERDKAGRWHNRYAWRYYAACAASATRIYALFAGHRTDQKPGAGIPVLAETVHVFDWSGKFQGALRLDHRASAIATSGDSVLFAAGEEEPAVYRYSIPRGVSPPSARLSFDSSRPN